VERERRRDDARPLQSEAVTVRISRLRLERDEEPEATCHGQRLPSCRVSDAAVLEGLIEPPTASASLEPIMLTASTASMGLLTSSRQQPRRDDDIGSLCRNASPSRKGAFSCSVINPSIAQHARFIATTVYRTCGIDVTSAVGSVVVYPYIRSVPGPEQTEAMPSRRQELNHRRRFDLAGPVQQAAGISRRVAEATAASP